MSGELGKERTSAVELLELHDRLDRLDEELRVQKVALRLTPLVSVVLAVPVLVALFLAQVPYFAAYPSTFAVLLGAILCALTVERRRLEEKREATRSRIRRMEEIRSPDSQPPA